MKKNVRNLMMLAIVAGSLNLISCRDNKEENASPPVQNEMHSEDMDHDEEMGHDSEMMENSGEMAAEFNDESTAQLYHHYLGVKQALVATDAAMAQSHAEKMIADLASNESNQEIAAAAKSIATSTDINKQREAFSKLTAAMEPVLTGAIESGEIYKQFCPMAFEGKGDYWYSNSKEIRNPYYGDKMLKCGRVEATIN